MIFFKLYFLLSVSFFYKHRQLFQMSQCSFRRKGKSNYQHCVEPCSHGQQSIFNCTACLFGRCYTTTPSVDASTEVPLAPSKNSSKGKRKKVASSSSKAKRAHEGIDVEGLKKENHKVLIWPQSQSPMRQWPW